MLLNKTQSVCQECLKVVDAEVVSIDEAVYLAKSCPQHGASEMLVWPDREHYEWMKTFSFPFVRPKPFTASQKGCPRDCGPCTGHLRKPTLVEIEITRRCNLRCPVCFMSAGKAEDDLPLSVIGEMFHNIRRQAGVTPGIQITGGEPTVREDLAEIVALGRQAGFEGIEVNTNGLVIAHDIEFLARLKDAGLTGIYLQFDGLTPGVYTRVRGANLLGVKMKAIENCRRVGIQVVLAMTVIDGTNLDQVGEVLRFALRNVDVVAGLALQPAFTSGRFEVGDPRRLNMGDVIFTLAKQCPDLIAPRDFYPLGCSHPICSCGTYLVPSPEGFVPVTREITPAEYRAAFDAESPQGSVLGDILLQRTGEVPSGLSLVIMNYMDAATMDIERLRECSMVVAVPDGRILPFCSYHLTSCSGERIHSAHVESVVPVEAVR
ncbi:MAG: radical SAM protein [Acidobacteriota bacterium]|nr:radical SAM protein [Acidobacteriota bacterium]